MAYGNKANVARKVMPKTAGSTRSASAPSPSARAYTRANANARFKRTSSTGKMAGNNAGRRKAFKRNRATSKVRAAH